MTEHPIWWPAVPQKFRERCEYVHVPDWQASPAVEKVKEGYISLFGEETVTKRISENNWNRADLCLNAVPDNLPIMDIGSGLGEFVNLFAVWNPDTPIASVDVKDYSIWTDLTGRIERIHKSLFDMTPADGRDVVTCFEVIEHLPPPRLEEAVKILRSLARRKLFVSIPFMEPLPLYRGHFTRFDAKLIEKLFPDARYTLYGRGGSSPARVYAWLMCEVAIA